MRNAKRLFSDITIPIGVAKFQADLSLAFLHIYIDCFDFGCLEKIMRKWHHPEQDQMRSPMQLDAPS